MKRRQAEYVDYQERGLEFEVGDVVVLYGANNSQAGRVTSVFPGIGYVDVEFPGANERVPVEDLVRLDSETGAPEPPYTNSAPVTDLVRTALESVKLAAEQSYLSKVTVLKALQDCPERVSTLGLRVATELWAAKDPGSMPLILDQLVKSRSKTASVSCLQRKQQGRKPFIASAWSQSEWMWFRNLETQLLSNLRLATVEFNDGFEGNWVWSIGAKTASGFTNSLDEAVAEVDRRLAKLGYALR